MGGRAFHWWLMTGGLGPSQTQRWEAFSSALARPSALSLRSLTSLLHHSSQVCHQQLTNTVHSMSGISFDCVVWCPSAFTSLPGLESFPLGSNGLFHIFIPTPGFTTLTVWPSCATHLLSCLEPSSFDVVPDILSGPISYTCRCAHMQVEGLLEMIACLRVFKLPNFEARGELALGFWRHINPHVTYKKLML